MNKTKLAEFYKGLDYSASDSFYMVYRKYVQWYFTSRMQPLLKPKERAESNVNFASGGPVYFSGINTLSIPAGYLNSVFFKSSSMKAYNYGTTGYIAGWLLTFPYSKAGGQYNADGIRVNWWSPNSTREFNSRSSCLARQYSKYIYPGTDIKVNGSLTSDGNIADIGGLKLAYQAYKNWIAEQGGRDEPRLPGLQNLSGDQIFFLAYAHTKCGNMRPDEARKLAVSNNRAPNNLRAIVPMMNMPEFADAFKCPKGSKMNPDDKDRCSFW
jgi:predicted metalloendopeptidase